MKNNKFLSPQNSQYLSVLTGQKETASPQPDPNISSKNSLVSKIDETRSNLKKHKFARLFYKNQNNALKNEKYLLFELIDSHGMTYILRSTFNNLRDLSKQKNKADLELVREIGFLHKVAELIPESIEEIQSYIIEYLNEPLSKIKEIKKNQAANRLELIELLTTINPNEGKSYYGKLSPNWKKASYNRLIRGLNRSGLPWELAIEQVDQL